MVAGCSRDDGCHITDPSGSASDWQKHAAFTLGNTILLAAHASDEMLLIHGWAFFHTITQSGDVVHWSNWGANEINYPIRPSDQLHVLVSPQAIRVRPNANPVSLYTSLWVSGTDLIPTFSHWVAGPYETGCFNEADQLLLAVHYEDNDGYTREGYALLDLRVDTDTFGQAVVVMTGSQFIKPPNGGETQSLRTMVPLDDGYLFSTDRHIWHLSHEGTLKSVHDGGAWHLFVDGEMCYAIASSDQFLRSSDGGATWHDHGSTNSRTIRFSKVGDETIVVLHDRIYQTNLETFETTELETEFLRGNEITSVTEFSGDVWVTTLSGLYHRPLDAFFTAAPTESKNGGLWLAPESAAPQ